SNYVRFPDANVSPVAGPTATTLGTISSASVEQLPFSFFMHDIFGGSAPTSRVVAGKIAAATKINTPPFSKPNNYGGVFPMNGGQFLPGAPMQKLLFGTITVLDDELTKGHELGYPIIGKAQGFHLATSMDGSSHTMVFAAVFHNEDHHYYDTISFFGVHRTAAARDSQLAIVGGTGKYTNAKGYAAIQTLHLSDQHITDGVDTILQFNVYLMQ
ncbi:hypothetical protein I3842_13G099800, partial [Carya illinoinensis]